MPIYQTAHYQVKPAAVDAVKAAIETFIRYVKDNEQGTKLYASWQQEDDPTRFVHLFIFESDEAHVTSRFLGSGWQARALRGSHGQTDSAD